MTYLWIKALHVLAIISWMAALLYLPRLMVYHAGTSLGTTQSETFKVMERRLLKAIGTPAMIVSWITGLVLVYQAGWYAMGWFHLKFLCVVAMTIMHMAMARWVRQFADDQNTHDAKFFRIMNEVPTLLMIFIVVAVIVKPF
ncbi:MAG: protoporphyrinogen oxidase HemJ [Pseudomonadota bacterium]